jgi:transcriptional regulator with XRE-family HTH domain
MNNTRNEALVAKLGMRVKELREQKGMSMQDLANECQIEKKLVYLIEHGKSNPTVSTMELIASALEMKLNELFAGI